MSKTILVCGYGTGISDAVAHKFGSEGFSVALVARSAQKLSAGVKALQGKGIKAQAFETNLGDPQAVKSLVGKVRESLGPITIVHWNAYAAVAGDLTNADLNDFRTGIDVSVTGLIAAVQAALPDLKTQANAAVLITGGGFALYDPQIDAMAAQWGAMGIAVAKAAQHKLAGVLSAKLKADNIYVGEVVVLGSVKGTAFDQGNATLNASDIANKFWESYTARTTLSVNFAG
jgi:NADP-dependent 3-hydroxy acid dehydrogenase YdfG